MARILMVNGSRNLKGFNQQLLNKIEELIGNRAEVSLLDWSGVPFFLQTREFPSSVAVIGARHAVGRSDAIWFVSPEYNHQIPGGLKNLTDWLSRSLDPANPRGESVIHGKITTVSSAGADGGSHVRPLLEDLLEFIRTQVVRENATGVAIKPENWASGVLTFTDDDIARLNKQVETLLAKLA